jgi:type I restriction enzyme S subunit
MKVKFGDVVRDVKNNVDRSNNPYEFYVAGDHMDSEDFHINRRGAFATDDVGPAFVRIFNPGQVLYGSRRTYLKKVCVADFAGVCANTTFVFETKNDDAFSQRLLPFIMLSDAFTDWSIKHSKGSTNPYVLFSDLADYEFDLPSMEEQKKLAELLWAANDLKEKYKKAITATDEMLKAKFREMFGCVGNGERGMGNGEGSSRGDAEMRSLKEFVKIVTGKRDANFGNEKGMYPFYTCAKEVSHCDSYSFDCDAILIAGNCDIGNISRYNGKFEAYQRTYVLTLSDNATSLDYLYWVLKLLWVEETRRKMNGSTIPYIKLGMLADYEFPLPSLSIQREFIAIAEKAESAKTALKKSIADIDQVMKGLINQ